MATTQIPPDADLIELEPTMHVDLFDPLAAGSPGALRPDVVAMPEATMASLAGETDTLRRDRLLAAAVFLAAAYGLLMTWVFASDNPGTLTAEGSRFSLRVGLLGLRCVLAAVIAGLVASEVPLTRKGLRVVENVLFLGLTVLMMASLYFVGLDLMQRGPEYAPTVLAFFKDGVIQMLVLMMIYGMLIPNSPSVATRVLVVMFVGPLLPVFLLRMHPEAARIIAQLGEAEQAGSNILFLGIGTALAIYGAFLVNGLRRELHQALKFGQYQLVRKLGAGGMGEVYLAEHQLLKRPCALKLIKPEAAGDALALARFEREVKSAAQLAHPNTIAIFDYGHTADGTFYYVMEFLQGLALSDLVAKYGPLPPGRVIYLLRQVCAGLSEAHGLGLVHRDLKPANVFVATRGGEFDVAKVLDFGLVKVQDPTAPALTSANTVSGTPLFMAPEQATGGSDLDARADIYALGAVAYFTLTGRPPFEGTTAFEVMMAHARDAVVPPSQVRPGVPADLEQVVLRCLEKKAENRYPTVRAMGEALAACAAADEWGPNRAESWWKSIAEPTAGQG